MIWAHLKTECTCKLKWGAISGGGGQLEKYGQLWEEVDDTRGLGHAGSLDHAGLWDAQHLIIIDKLIVCANIC